VTVVSDSGPLMALAKVGGLDVLFRLFPTIHTPPAVHAELITAGLRLGAPDVAALQERYRSRELLVTSPQEAPLPVVALLGPGEEQCILLAIERKASWVLIDDLAARHAAIASLHAAGSDTGLKGTLGVIVAARESEHLSKDRAVALIEALRLRKDIWISSDLCDRALLLLDP